MLPHSLLFVICAPHSLLFNQAFEKMLLNNPGDSMYCMEVREPSTAGLESH